MKRILQLTAALVLLLGSSCQQFAQRPVEPISPPAPETLVKPLSPELKARYTLPKPL